MPKHKRMTAGPGGWSEWQQPVMKGYRMACCDCGLVHEMEFEVLKKGKDKPDGSWEAREMDPEMYRVSMRARRHNRATAATRRKRK